MSTFVIFCIGLLVSAITFAGAVLVGLEEAADPSQSRPEDLANFEREVVDRDDVA